MRIPRPRPSPPSRPRSPSWLRLPRRTARLRLTVLYGGACLAFGVILLAVSYLVAKQGTIGILSRSTDTAGSGLHPGPSVQHLTYSGQQQSQPEPAATLSQMGFLRGIAFERQQLLIRFGIALAIGTAAAVALGWVLAGRVLHPLRKVTAAARRISASSLHERLALQGPGDELKELGDTLDDLFARLEASFDAQRRFAANASHELRSPLTRERALLEVTLADPASTTGTWQAVSRELLASNAEQERLVEALLTLASSEGGLDQREPADLATITSAALAAAHPEISRLGLHVQTRIQPAALDGDPGLIQRLVTNLTDNAIRHNIPGGDIQIATRTSHSRAVLSVTSSGPVIPPAQVDRLFQPFQRPGPRRARRDNGHGLGLAIVMAIATSHGATITAQPRPGGGLVIDVTFPPPAPPQTRRPAPDTQPASRPAAYAPDQTPLTTAVTYEPGSSTRPPPRKIT